MDRGWSSDPSALPRALLLTWIHERQATSAAEPEIADFVEEQHQYTCSDIEDMIAVLERDGLVHVTHMGGGLMASSITLTPEGIASVKQLHHGRSDAKRRTRAAREALLDWLYAQQRAGVNFPALQAFRNDCRAWVDGCLLEESEIDDAAIHLRDRALVRAQVAWGDHVIRARIEAIGEQVVEDFDGSITSWSQSQRATDGPASIETHFHGEVSGQIGIGDTVVQHQQQGLGSDSLARLLDEVRDAAAAVPDGDRDLVMTYVNLIEVEAMIEEPSPQMVRGAGERLALLAGKIGNAGLIATVTALVNHLARSLGLG